MSTEGKPSGRQPLDLVQAKFREVLASLEPRDVDPAEQLRECEPLLDELTDLLLETPEPERTYYLQYIAPLRQKVKDSIG
jgi:hypothetical protein